MPQRWVRPFLDEPGRWRGQLPNKYLAVGVRGVVPELRQMLRAHPEFLSKRGNHNRTLLWEAARRGRLPAVKWLVEQGAEVDATGCYNSESLVQLTAYCAASYYRRAEVAAYLLARGARLDVFRAAFMGEQAQVAQALAADPDLLQVEDPFDLTYFVPVPAFAVAGGQAGLLAFLFQQGAPVAPYSAQLLHLAARLGRMDLVEQLVAHGADPRAADTSIFVALSDLSMARYLLEHGTSATRAGSSGFAPLIYAARGDKGESPEKAQLLLDWGAPVNEVGPRGRTALHYAAAAGHVAVMRVLLAHGAEVSLTDETGATPLSLAWAGGKTAAVQLLRQWNTHQK
jgi:ankyrin